MGEVELGICKNLHQKLELAIKNNILSCWDILRMIFRSDEACVYRKSHSGNTGNMFVTATASTTVVLARLQRFSPSAMHN